MFNYFHIFGYVDYILADCEERRKLDLKSDRDIFLEYSSNSRGYHVFNKRIRSMMDVRKCCDQRQPP